MEERNGARMRRQDRARILRNSHALQERYGNPVDPNPGRETSSEDGVSTPDNIIRIDFARGVRIIEDPVSGD